MLHSGVYDAMHVFPLKSNILSVAYILCSEDYFLIAIEYRGTPSCGLHMFLKYGFLEVLIGMQQWLSPGLYVGANDMAYLAT